MVLRSDDRCETAFEGGRRGAVLVILTVYTLIPGRLTPFTPLRVA
jgi:hypothetical protein